MATATHQVTEKEAHAHPVMDAMVVRFAGDSGDGMQLTGGQFTLSTALAGNDLATFPDFPAEIRARSRQRPQSRIARSGLFRKADAQGRRHLALPLPRRPSHGNRRGSVGWPI